MMLSTPILLDYQSSTPCLEDVVNSMAPYWSEIFSNPSSKSNLAGINASAILEVSREKIKEYLFLQKKKLIFTSGATESNNLALLGFARNFYKKTENEDLESISRGISGFKGSVVLNIGDVMNFESDSYEIVAEQITNKISNQFHN